MLHDRLAGYNLTAGTVVVNDRQDLQQALDTLGSPVWLRCAEGPRGRGSIVVEHVDDGVFWMDYWRRRDAADDVWLAHEYLPGRNLNWTSIWKQGGFGGSCLWRAIEIFLVPGRRKWRNWKRLPLSISR